ncbi:hypothetical protein B1810_14915 [Panacagrimonas perspica]|nr:hypothetical protein B1810_14915 [Panacagrimonas perspica]
MRVNPVPDLSSAETYRDPKRHAWLFYPLWLLMPAISIALGLQTGHTAWFWLVPAFLFIGMPILDLVIGTSTRNAPEPAVPRLESDPYYRYLTYFCVVFHYLALIVGAWAVATQPLDVLGYIGVTLSCGLISAYGIVTAHELGHKKGSLERWLSKFALATGVYGQYMTDHNRGHHRDVATPEDSGSARFGENFYAFMLMRQLPHSTFSRPWQLEKDRLSRKGKSVWSLGNEFIQPTLISLVTYGILTAIFGLAVVPYLAAVAFTSYFFLAIIDYIEHYGLLRKKLPDGRYERVRPEHSWNTDHVATNIMYMHAQRHSDHHAYPTRRYQVLRSYPNLPTLPNGYPGMFWLAMFPPLWRAVMHPRILQMYDFDLNRINLDPGKRDALFKKYSRVPDASKALPAAAPAQAASSPTASVSVTANAAPKSYKCPGCGYTYREANGDASQGFAAGTRWAQIPFTWSCPDCAVRDKVDFVEVHPARANVHA